MSDKPERSKQTAMRPVWSVAALAALYTLSVGPATYFRVKVETTQFYSPLFQIASVWVPLDSALARYIELFDRRYVRHGGVI